MPPSDIIEVDFHRLLLDLENPRTEPQQTQRQAMEQIAGIQGPKLLKLAEDMLDFGMDPSSNLIVSERDEDGEYVVLDGNRRVTAIKLMSNLELLNSLDILRATKTAFQRLYARGGQSFPPMLRCAVMQPDDARHWIALRHNGVAQDGVATLPWDLEARKRYRGDTVGLQVRDLVLEYNPDLPASTRSSIEKYPLTNFERILRNKNVGQLLDITIKKNQLHCNGDERHFVAKCTAILVALISNKVRVREIYKADQIETFVRGTIGPGVAVPADRAQFPVSQSVPVDVGSFQPPANTGETSSDSLAVPDDTAVKNRRPSRISPDRTTLIPSTLKIRISLSRINLIYTELRKLQTKDYPNSCAMLLRLFVELNTNHYMKANKIEVGRSPRRTCPHCHKEIGAVREESLKNKIAAVCKHLEVVYPNDKDQFVGYKNFDKDLVDLNSYVHNMHFHPTVSVLHTMWNNIEPFIIEVWRG